MKLKKLKFALYAPLFVGIAVAGFSAPIITLQPANQPVILDANASFQVQAVGISPLRYQWQFKGGDLTAATNSNLGLSNVQPTDAGDYFVVVSDSSGAVTSRVARLDIIPDFTKTSVNGGNYFGGAAWMDYDGDGYLDLVVANGVATQGKSNGLYHNLQDGTFIQITTGPIATDIGNTLTLAWGDYDNDGLPDLYCGAAFGSTPTVTNLLYHNLGGGHFERVTTGNLATAKGNFTVAWADFDNDGFLDVFLANTGGTNFLFHNNGDGTFSSIVGSMSTPHPSPGGLATFVTLADYDNDGYLDIFLTGSTGPNTLFHNNRKGTFTQVEDEPFNTDFGPSATSAWGDYDNDGYLDLFVSNGNFDSTLRNNYLYHNNRNGTFTKVTSGPIVTSAGSAIFGAWEDFDNDGNLDLFVSQNTGSGGASQNLLYHNNGDGSFSRVSSGAIASDSGHFAGVAWGDYDNDGFPDLFVADGTQSLLYHNQRNNNNWISFRLVGTISNRSAVGAKVRVKATIRGMTTWQLREITNGNGNSLNPHFGLGDATNIDLVRIEWPSGTVQEIQNVAAKQNLTVSEPSRLLISGGAQNRQVLLRGGRNLQYDVQASSNLTAWSSLGAITITNLDGRATITDTNTSSSGAQFYRAVLEQ